MTPEALYRIARRFHVRARRTLAGSLAGLARTVFRGRGLSFEEVRPYQPGDEVRDIDWKVTARMGRPFLKKYADEREQTLWLLLDESGSMQFGSGTCTKQETAHEVVALLALAAAANADRVGVVTFGRRQWVCPPRRRTRQALRLIRDLLAEPAASATTAVAPTAAVDTLRHLARKRALVFVISDLLFERPWTVVAPLHRRHQVTVLRIVDPFEQSLPNCGLVRWQDAETGALRLIDTGSARFRDEYAAQARCRERTLRHEFARWDIPCRTILTNRPAGVALLEQFR